MSEQISVVKVGGNIGARIDGVTLSGDLDSATIMRSMTPCWPTR